MKKKTRFILLSFVFIVGLCAGTVSAQASGKISYETNLGAGYKSDARKNKVVYTDKVVLKKNKIIIYGSMYRTDFKKSDKATYMKYKKRAFTLAKNVEYTACEVEVYRISKKSFKQAIKGCEKKNARGVSLVITTKNNKVVSLSLVP